LRFAVTDTTKTKREPNECPVCDKVDPDGLEACAACYGGVWAEWRKAETERAAAVAAYECVTKAVTPGQIGGAEATALMAKMLHRERDALASGSVEPTIHRLLSERDADRAEVDLYRRAAQQRIGEWSDADDVVEKITTRIRELEAAVTHLQDERDAAVAARESDENDWEVLVDEAYAERDRALADARVFESSNQANADELVRVRADAVQLRKVLKDFPGHTTEREWNEWLFRRDATLTTKETNQRIMDERAIREQLLKAADQLDELTAERDRLRECMRRAGLHAFIRDKSPEYIAEHLQRVIKSWSSIEKEHQQYDLAIRHIFKTVGAVSFENNEDEPAQAALTEVYNSCTIAIPKLDPDYEPEEDADEDFGAAAAEVRDRLWTQDNRCTGDPLFIIQQKRRMYGIESGWHDSATGYIWTDRDDPEYSFDSDADLLEHLNENLNEKDESLLTAEDLEDAIELSLHEVLQITGHTYDKIYYQEVWEFVCAHFTEEAANIYVTQNAHNLKEPRVYVTSQYRCHEWNAVRRFLMTGKWQKERTK
jgi:hypothetical protein